MSRTRDEEVVVDPFADVYGEIGERIWDRESEKVLNPNAFTAEHTW
jgi:hypothetical protein